MNSAQRKITKTRGPVMDDFSTERRTASVSSLERHEGHVSVTFEPYSKTQTSKQYKRGSVSMPHDIERWTIDGTLPRK